MKKTTKERPILFSAPMVRAILSGKKTMTRRVVKPQPEINGPYGGMPFGRQDYSCPFGCIGDRLWVRETWADVNTPDGPAICYRADGSYQSWHDFCVDTVPGYHGMPSMNYDKYPGDYTMWWEDLLNRETHKEPGYKWRPSIFMPRWASRINLENTGVRVERLKAISDEDAKNEGVELGEHWIYTQAFEELWDSINGKTYPWENNPWVRVIKFKMV